MNTSELSTSLVAAYGSDPFLGKFLDLTSALQIVAGCGGTLIWMPTNLPKASQTLGVEYPYIDGEFLIWIEPDKIAGEDNADSPEVQFRRRRLLYSRFGGHLHVFPNLVMHQRPWMSPATSLYIQQVDLALHPLVSALTSNTLTPQIIRHVYRLCELHAAQCDARRRVHKDESGLVSEIEAHLPPVSHDVLFKDILLSLLDAVDGFYAFDSLTELLPKLIMPLTSALHRALCSMCDEQAFTTHLGSEVAFRILHAAASLQLGIDYVSAHMEPSEEATLGFLRGGDEFKESVSAVLLKAREQLRIKEGRQQSKSDPPEEQSAGNDHYLDEILDSTLTERLRLQYVQEQAIRAILNVDSRRGHVVVVEQDLDNAANWIEDNYKRLVGRAYREAKDVEATTLDRLAFPESLRDYCPELYRLRHDCAASVKITPMRLDYFAAVPLGAFEGDWNTAWAEIPEVLLCRFYTAKWLGFSAWLQELDADQRQTLSQSGWLKIRAQDSPGGSSSDVDALRATFRATATSIEVRIKPCILSALGVLRVGAPWPDYIDEETRKLHRNPRAFEDRAALGQAIWMIEKYYSKVESSLLMVSPDARIAERYVDDLHFVKDMANKLKHTEGHSVLDIDVIVAEHVLKYTDKWYAATRRNQTTW